MKKVLLGLFLIIIVHAYGQTGTSGDGYEYIPKVPTPEIANLGKFVETPVSLNKGIPTIDTPLFTINSGSYSLPIVLNYHAGGVRVDETSSWVGLGWKLSTDGIITRQQRGNPDNYGFIGTQSLSEYFNSSDVNQKLKRNSYLTYAIGDYEADVYSISCGAISGKFIYVQSLQTFVDDTDQKLKINYDSTTDSWKILDSQGVVYIFSHISGEKTETFFTINGNLTHTDDDRPTATDVWKISKIISKEGKEITFEYQMNGFFSEYFSKGIKKKNIDLNPYFNISNDCTPEKMDEYIEQFNREYSTSLKKIKFPEGHVEFKWADVERLDKKGQYNLKSIELHNMGGQLVKKLNLIHSFIQSSASGNLENQYKYRMYLDRIDEQDPVNPNDIQLYRVFTYLNRNSLPSKLSSSIDFWGGYNSNQNNSLIPRGIYEFSVDGTKKKILVDGGNRQVDSNHATDGLLSKIILPTKGEITYTYESNWIKADQDNQDLNPFLGSMEEAYIDFYKSSEFIVPNNPMKYQMPFIVPNTNFKINADISMTGCNVSGPTSNACHYKFYVFPNTGIPPTSTTGGTFILPSSKGLILSPGSYILVAEPRDTDSTDETFHIGLNFINQIISDKYLVGGARIQKIELKDSDTKIEKNYDYSYFGTNIPSGKIQRTPVYSRQINSLRKCYHPLAEIYDVMPINYLKIKSNPNVPLTDDVGSSIFYENVTEYQKDLNNPLNSIKTEYKFSYEKDQLQSSFNFDSDIPVQSFSNKRGNLLEKKIYKLNEVLPIKIETYNYDYFDQNFSNINMFWIAPDPEIQLSHDVSYATRNSFRYLTKITAKERLGGSDLLKDILFDYNISDRNKTHETIVFPDSTTSETTYQYATEKANQKLITANMVSIPLETEVKKDGKTISKTETKYDNPANLLPSSVLSQDLQSSAMETDITFYQYDTKGNLQQYTTKDEIPTAIIWGYNQTQPIAKIEGAKYSDVSASVGEIISYSDIDANPPQGTTPEQTEQNLINKLDEFRKKAELSGNQITTYTYDPLIGVRTITPPSGIREYYNYDTANRLNEVKDINGNILKTYEYHYKP